MTTLKINDRNYSPGTGKSVVLQCDEKYESAEEVLAFPGPLLRAGLKKDKLMRFIQNKREECLLHLDEPLQQKSFFFWSIMEHFCNSDGRVLMCEIALLLHRGYSLMRKKLGRVKNQEQWCIPLAKLLCSAAPDDQLREDIIKMGKKFESRDWTYAAHICFVLAQVELGSDFNLIGCESVPEDKKAMLEALERTEVYEYVLSLTSGVGQICFQDIKLMYAFELFKLGYHDQALQYCKTIAAELIRCPSHTDLELISTLMRFTDKLLKSTRDEDIEWLEMRQQLEESKCAAPSLFHPSQFSEVNSLYIVREQIGKGGFGSVFAGYRKTDGKQVAIKCVAKQTHEKYITIPGETQSLPLEVALMVMVSKPRCDYIVELLEWFETPEFLILVLERPDCCMDLNDFLYLKNYKLSEIESQMIMKQAVLAARHCCDCGVLHRDIKLENFLIIPGSLKLKLIDFGCGDLLTEEVYTNYMGTAIYCPPEWFLYEEYLGVPATVWSLGIVLYALVCGNLPFNSTQEITEGKLMFPTDISSECRMLINWCLHPDPKNRPTFEEILNHRWFTKELKDTDKLRQF